MALIAHIVPANGGRIVEKLLNKEVRKLAIPKGANLEIINTETGAHVSAHSVEASGQGLLLKFATPDGDVELQLSGDIGAFLAQMQEAASADAASFTDGAEQVADGAAESQAEAADEDGKDGDDHHGGVSPALLGILGLGVLGGIAAAASGGGNGGNDAPEDTIPPSAPAALDLAMADDAGLSGSDNITKNGSSLTISGTAEANARVELFDGSTSLGTATADASGKFTLDVSLAEGAHSITAKATDAAGNVGAASSALSITVDATAPTAAIAMGETHLISGETTSVTITFSEPVVDFSNADLTIGSGTLSQLVSSDGGLTWTATFTADSDVSEPSNVIALGTGYSDIAGNEGTAATSADYAVDAITFTVTQPEDGSVSFGGSASGPITITLNARDEAEFSRDGKSADAVIASISTKVMNVPEGGELNIVLDGEASSDTFTLDAPNAAAMIFTGNGGALSDTLSIIIESASADPDLRTLKVDTSALTGVEAIRFVFPEDARDVVKLTADSDLSGFTTIEVSKGGLDLTSIDVQQGVEFIVNSTLILTLAQFEEMSSLTSVTGLGQLVINLTADEVQSGALEAFLESDGPKPILIGTTVTVHDQDGHSINVPDALDAISYPGIPELSDRLDALEGQIDDLAIGDVSGLAAQLSSLSGAITALQSSTALGSSEQSARIDALEDQLAGITDTVVSYVDAQIGGLQSQIDGLAIDDIAELAATLTSLNGAIDALQGSTGSINDTIGHPADLDADPTVAATGLYLAIEQAVAALADEVGGQIADLQSQVDGLGIDDIAELADTLSSLNDAIDALQGSTGSISDTIGHPADPNADPMVPATGLYLAIEQAVAALADEVDGQIADLQSQVDGLGIDDIAELADTLSSLNDAIDALQGSTGSISDTIGHPADPNADPMVPATGLYLAIEQAVAALADEVDGQIAGLQSQIDGLGIDDVAELATTLSSLTESISDLSALTGEDGPIDQRLSALESQLEGITGTVVAYVDAQIDALKNDAAGEDGPSLDSIAGLRAAIEALLDGSGLGNPETEGTLAYQLAHLQSQIDTIMGEIGGDEIAPTVLDVHLDSALGADGLGHLNAGDVVSATVNFSEAVLVTGNPTLSLTIGDGEDARVVQATLTGGAGTDTLTFTYTIGGEDDDATGISIGANALVVGEDGGITDKAGNALDPLFAAVADNDAFIVDNGPLELTVNNSSIFGPADLSGSIFVGLLTTGYGEDTQPVSLDDLDENGEFIVPDGQYFISMGGYFTALLAGEDDLGEDWFTEHTLAAGQTFSSDFDGKLIVEMGSTSILVGEAALRDWLGTRSGQEMLAETGVSTADEFIGSYTHTLDELATGSVISPDFLALIAGHEPADVLLDITSPLTVAQAAALAAAGFDLPNNVDYDVRDYYTTVQAALANPDQQAALENAGQVIARGDELDNIVSMTAFNEAVNLRTELGAGDDIYNAGRGDELIVGQQGADTINLTTRDLSADGIVYQSVHDGRTANVVDLTYSTGEDDYREGSHVSVTINGHEYTYTTGDDGETPSEALNHLADTVMAKQVTGRVVIGMNFHLASGAGLVEDGPVYQDEMKDGAYTVQAGHYFLSVTDYFRTLETYTVIDDQNVRDMSLSGGETFKLTSEEYLQVGQFDYLDGYEEFETPLQGAIVLTNPDLYQAFLENYDAIEPYNPDAAASAAAEAIRYRDVADVRVDSDSGKLTFVGGVYDHDMAIDAGSDSYGEDDEAIVNPGQAAMASITFSAGEDDYPAFTNGEDTTLFDRELRVTISGKTITANVVPGDPEESVENLREAIQSALDENATNAITAATSTITLDAAIGEETALAGYSLTLTVNDQAVTLSDDDGATIGDLMDAIRAVGGVQSVTLEEGKLVVTGEVRGSVAADNTVSMSAIVIDGTPYVAADVLAVGGSLGDLIDSVDRDGTELTFTGYVPATDDDAPTFTIDNGEIDKPGVQEERTISFSNDDADYYEGGELHVTINGETIEADMIAGSAHDSMAALVSAINVAIGEDADHSMLLESADLEQLPEGATGDVQLHLVASTEAPGALQVTDVQQDYRGEEQTATISLEDALHYTAQAGEDAATADRFADVYYEGGKVYASFTPRVDDGDGGLMDGEAVTVSADMVMTGGTSNYSNLFATASYYVIGGAEDHPFGFSITIEGTTYTEGDFATYLSNLDPSISLPTNSAYETGEAATFQDLANWLATLDGVADAILDVNTGITVTYEAGIDGAINDFTGAVYNSSYSSALYLLDNEQASIGNAEGIGDPEATAQALADAINAATQQVVHFNFDMGDPAHAPLTLDTALTATDDTKISLLVSVDGFGSAMAYSGEDVELLAVDTVGEMLDWLNEQYEGHGVWSLNAAGDGIDLTVAADADVVTVVAPIIGLADGMLPVDAGLTTTDEASLSFIGHADVGEDGTITVTASEVGKDTFHISDVTMDYEGVHQIATATFDATGNYYTGGTVSIDIDTTPGEDGGIVHVQANMVDGDREASLQNLVDEINSYTVAGEDTAAVAFMKGSELLTDATTNGGDDLDAGLYFSSWSVTVIIDGEPVTYSGRGEAVIVDGVTEWHELGEYPSQFDNLGAFHNYVKTLDGVDNATLDEHGNIIVTSTATGSDAYISGAFDVAKDAADPDSVRFSASASDYGSGGALAGIIDHAELGEDGTITIVSADATRDQFSIADAEITRQPVHQEAEAQYSTNDERYFEGGVIGMTVNGVTVETDMLMQPASSSLSAWGSTGAPGLMQIYTPDHIIGSVGSSVFAFSITIDGTSHTQDEFITYLEGLPTPLSIPTDLGFDDPAPTFQDLANWIMTLDGVDKATFDPDNGFAVTFDRGVDGQMDSIAGQAYVSDSVMITVGLAFATPPTHTPPNSSGDPEATLDALRDEIWQQVTHATGTIDVDDSWTEDTVISGELSITSMTPSQDMTSGSDLTVGDLLNWLRNESNIESAELVDGQLVITAKAGEAPFDFQINGDFTNFMPENWHVGNDLFGAFSSVSVEDGDINFTAADTVDGYGEINISDVYMSVQAQEQITEIDFDDVDFANGLVDQNGERADVSVSIAGQTITVETQDSEDDTIRALAQAIIEARDGTFAEEVVSVGAGDLAAVVRIGLPDGVDGDTRLMNDDLGHDSTLAFAVSFSDGGPEFTYAPDSSFNMSVEELVDDLNSQLETWSDGEDYGSFSYDADANQIVVKSHARGEDAYVGVGQATITSFWENDGAHIQSSGADVGLAFSQPDAVTSGNTSIRIDVTPDDDKFFTADGSGSYLIDGNVFSEVPLLENSDGWSGALRYEMHLTFTDGSGAAHAWDFYSGGEDYPSWLGDSDMTDIANWGDGGHVTLSTIVQQLNAELSGLGGVGTILLDGAGQIVVQAAPGYTVALGGEDSSVGNDLRIDIGNGVGEVEKSLIANDENVLRVHVPQEFYSGGTGGEFVDGVETGFATLAYGEDNGSGGADWFNTINEYLHLVFDTGSGEVSYDGSFSSSDLTGMDLNADHIITLDELVARMNADLSGYGSIELENGDIVITPDEGSTVRFAATGGEAGLHIESDYYLNPTLDATGSYNVNGAVETGEDGLATTLINLPTGVTGGSMIHGIAGGYFTLDEASTDIRVTFTFDGEDVQFTAPTSLDHDMTVAEFVAGLNAQLTTFETDNETGDLGAFTFEKDLNRITFDPADDNAALSSYQINAFNISAFTQEHEVIDGATASFIYVQDATDTGESAALVMHSDHGPISADDAISMDMVTVKFTIEGEEQSSVYRPDLIETPGETGSSVGDFLAWVETHFTGVQAAVIDGDIVFSGAGLESADVSLELLESSATLSSSAVGETGPTGGASGGSITLAEFAGLTGDEHLVGESVDFDVYVGGATAGEIISISYEIGEDATVDDLLDYIETYVATQTGDHQYLSATLGDDGIVLSTSGEGGLNRLWVSELSLTVEGERTNVVTAVANVLGQVDLDGDSIILHASDTGPDALNVGSLSYGQVDETTSVHQQLVVEFNNTKLDTITDGSVVSLTLLGITTSITVSADGTPVGDELDLSTISPNSDRSSVVLDELVQRLNTAHSDTVGEIVRGYLDGEGAFHQDSSATSTVLRFTAEAYGQEALGTVHDGTAQAVKATIVNAIDLEQFSVVAGEIRPGIVNFTTSNPDSDGVYISDGTDGDGDGQIGRNESVIHYQEPTGGEDATGSYVLDDITDGNPGVTLDSDQDDEFDYLGINDDAKKGVSPGVIDESYVNAGDGATGTDAGYYGEASHVGEDGVRQTYHNPDGSYTATDGSPVENAGNVSAGTDALYGGASGSYDLDGLNTDHLDGQTVVDGEDYYDVHQVGSEIAVTGAYHGEATDSDSGEDGFHGDAIQDGFAAFTWDDVLHSTVTAANEGSDIINHFQVDHDVIVFEGAIEDSTVVGSVDHVYAAGMLGRPVSTDFSLDHHEFGVVSSYASWLDVDDLSNADAVAQQLDEIFSMKAEDDDGENNSSIFTITAHDDSTTTAIWAHTQSYADDDTIDADELTLLAVLHTTGGEFGYYDNNPLSNLLMLNHLNDIPPP